MARYLEDQRMRPQLVGASQLLVVPALIENHWCHISLSVHVFANWMRWHMRGVDLRNMPQPRESIVLIEIWVVVLGSTFYFVDNMSWWRGTRIIGGCGHWIGFGGQFPRGREFMEGFRKYIHIMVWYLEDPRMRTQSVGASQLWVVPTWIENHWCHISLSVHVLANWMRWHMRGVDLRNMLQPRESIVLIEIWVAVLGGTFYYVDNMSWWRVTRIIGGCGHWIGFGGQCPRQCEFMEGCGKYTHIMARYLEDPRMRTQLVGASQFWVVPTWIENH